jgi:hypothetical protein
MYLHPSGSDKGNPLLLLAAILQFALLAVMICRSNDTMFDMFFTYRTIDAVIMFHALFSSLIVSSVWVHLFMDHNSWFLPMMTADAVLSNLATAVIASTIYVRASAVTAVRNDGAV